MKLITLEEAIERTGRSRSRLYDDIAAGRFPRPVKVGPRASRFVDEEINGYIAKRIAERDAQAAK